MGYRPAIPMLMLTLCVAMPLPAAEMIVTKRGESFRVEQSARDGTWVTYVDQKTGEKGRLPAGSVEGIIPLVTSGGNHTEAEIESALEKIQAISRRHVSLLRKLNVVKHEWLALRRVDPRLGEKLQREILSVQQNKSITTYQKALMNLQMLRFKHKGAAAEARIEKAIKSVKEAYLGMDLDAYAEETHAKMIKLPEYEALLAQGRAVLKEDLAAEDRRLIETCMAKAKDTVLTTLAPYARDGMASRPSINSYLKGRAALLVLARRVAETDEERKFLEGEQAAILDLAKKKLTMFDFSHNGFPVAKIDKVRLRKTADYSSTRDCDHIDVSDEWAYLVPHTVPSLPAMRDKLKITTSVIFSRGAERPTDFAFMILAMKHGDSLFKHYLPLSRSRIRNGRSDVRMIVDFARFPKGVSALQDDEGKHIMFFLVARPSSSKPGTTPEAWLPISKGCRIPVQPVEEP